MEEFEQQMNRIRAAQDRTGSIIQDLKALSLTAQLTWGSQAMLGSTSDWEETRQIVESNCRKLGIPLPKWDEPDDTLLDRTREIVKGNLLRLGLPLPPEWIDEDYQAELGSEQ